VNVSRNSTRFFSYKSIQILLYLLAFTLAALLVIWLNLSWRPDLQRLPPDSGFYAYFGKAILHWQMPYRDVWDDKPPLGYYLNALALLIFGQTAWGVWWSSVVWIIGLVVLFFAVIRKLFGTITAGICAVLFLLALMNPQIFQGGNMMEVYALAPQVIIIGVTYLFFSKKRTPWYAAAIGVLTAIAFLIKQPTIMLGFSSLSLLLLSSISKKRIRNAVSQFTGFILGLSGMLFIVSLYWILTGMFRQYIAGSFFQGFSAVGGFQSTIKENFYFTLITKIPILSIGSLYLMALLSGGLFLLEKLYRIWLKPVLKSGLSVYEWVLLAALVLLPLPASQLWPGYSLRRIVLISIFCLAVYILVKYYHLTRRLELMEVFSPVEWVWLVALVSLPFELVMVSLGGSFSGHYFTIMLPAVLLGVAYPIRRGISTVKINLPSKLAKLGQASYIILAIGIFTWGISSFVQDIPASEYTGSLAGIFSGKILYNELDQYIKETTQPDDEVLVWHIHLGINFLADRKAPRGVLFPLNLFIPPSDQNRKLEEYVNTIEQQPPELILVQKPSSIALPFVDQPIDQLCATYCAPQYEQAMQVPQIRQQWLRFQEYFNSHYALDTRIYDWIVYRWQP
jgi:4-amino-4-deoxy-L-arabinose transferase-like glycosyltransferase